MIYTVILVSRGSSVSTVYISVRRSADLTNGLPVQSMARVRPLKLARERLGNNLIRIVKILSSQKVKTKRKKSSTIHLALPNFTFLYYF